MAEFEIKREMPGTMGDSLRYLAQFADEIEQHGAHIDSIELIPLYASVRSGIRFTGDARLFRIVDREGNP